MPEFIKKIPIPVLLALLGPPLIIGGIVQVMMVNLGAGNQHLSSNADGFHEWLLWPLVGAGTADRARDRRVRLLWPGPRRG